MFSSISKGSIVVALGLIAAVVHSDGVRAAESDARDSVVIVWAGTLIATPGHPPLQEQSLVIRNGVIERIVAGRLSAAQVTGSAAESVRTIDWSRMYVLPGLFDLHVHLTTEPSAAGALQDVTQTSADLALLAADNAERALRAGFTTVLDMGTGRRAHELAISALKGAIASGRASGPRILTVGSPISSPGNSRTSRFAPDIERVIPAQGVCSGADDCRRAVREQVERGADVINFYNTGSLLSPGSPAQTFTDEEMRAIVETAHSLNRKAVADGAGKRDSAAGINAAIRAGADWVDTVIYPDTMTWTLLSKARRPYAPHLYAVVAAVGDDEQHIAEGSMGWLPPAVLNALLALKRETPAAKAAHASGIRMVFASDAGVFEHGRNAGEFLEYVKAGLTPSEAIATASVNAAHVLGLSAESGTLEAGKRADLIAVVADPLQDVRALQNVRGVIAYGRLVSEGGARAAQ
jgi:Imidazolonepropionase and related amidohydrolases